MTYASVTDTDVIKGLAGVGNDYQRHRSRLSTAHAAADVQKLGYIGGKAVREAARRFLRHPQHWHATRAVWVKRRGDFQGVG
ncbi:hypothetical protein JQ604_32305 [Bradyrhizobium jicamae]|uniref:hypothetical protein n=1 Tax=Bradyrhizobium jicamae TaxID=280332 RepID=UPI001BACC14D|nr:hypothetical protein [Bradyrhizobium jicamae]MBR0756888.1 hypothetical protein [Bradyrhizobium jicamae]